MGPKVFRSFLLKLPSCSCLSEKCHSLMWIHTWLLPWSTACGRYRKAPFFPVCPVHEPCSFLPLLLKRMSELFSLEQQKVPSAADSRQSSQPALQLGSLDDSCLQGRSTVTNSSALHSNCAPPDKVTSASTCGACRLCQQPFTAEKRN